MVCTPHNAAREAPSFLEGASRVFALVRGRCGAAHGAMGRTDGERAYGRSAAAHSTVRAEGGGDGVGYSSSSFPLRRNRLKSVKPISAARKPMRTSVAVGEGEEVK